MTRPMPRNGGRRAVAAVAGTVLATTALVACGSSKSTTPTSSSGSPSTAVAGSSSSVAAPSGAPISYMFMTSITGGVTFPEEVEAVKAAEAAINAAGGSGGRPIKVEVCDNKFNPNDAAACGRQAVADKVIAVVGDTTGFGDSYIPITSKAGIPAVGNLPSGAQDGANPLSFPLGDSYVLLAGEGLALQALGAKSVNVNGPDVPALTQLVGLLKTSLGPAKLSVKGFVPISVDPKNPPDFDQVVAQSYGAADGLLGVAVQNEVKPFLSAALAAGKDFTKDLTSMPGVAFYPALLQDSALKGKIDGLVMTTPNVTVTDSADPAVSQYLSELSGIGAKQDPSQIAFQAWSALHMLDGIIDTTPSAADSSASLVTALNSAGEITAPGFPPFDYTKPVFAGDPLFGKAFPRYFTNLVYVYRIKDNTFVPATDGPVNGLAPMTFTNAAG